LLLLLLVAPARADSVADRRADLFAQANAAYAEGVRSLASDPEGAKASFGHAAAAYRSLIQGTSDPPPLASGPLYYNLGNAELLAGDVGRAILAYRRAQRLMPLSADVRRNLAAARERAVGAGTGAAGTAPPGAREARPPEVLAFVEAVPARWRFYAFAGTFALAWVLGLLRLGRWGRPGRGVVAVVGAASAIALGSLLPTELGRDARAAVVVAGEVTGRSGPDDLTYEPSPATSIRGGTEVRVVEVRGEWILVRLADGTRSWLPRRAIEMVETGL
jgi:hypothetical protein